ncbi:unnamed protein product [Protopolystoma xenopodis]|uniref:Uncharacterized protein n=1 Tax=Protopolystoma xenopodis TaxID=117903 RepID=A0A3S5FEQ5_9PLAT|nr:unnamed protein product [Protopolystoma xenopodis]
MPPIGRLIGCCLLLRPHVEYGNVIGRHSELLSWRHGNWRTQPSLVLLRVSTLHARPPLNLSETVARRRQSESNCTQPRLVEVFSARISKVSHNRIEGLRDSIASKRAIRSQLDWTEVDWTTVLVLHRRLSSALNGVAYRVLEMMAMPSLHFTSLRFASLHLTSVYPNPLHSTTRPAARVSAQAPTGLRINIGRIDEALIMLFSHCQ